MQCRVQTGSFRWVPWGGARPLGHCPAVVPWKAVPVCVLRSDPVQLVRQAEQAADSTLMGPDRAPPGMGFPVLGSGFHEALGHGAAPTPEPVCEDQPVWKGPNVSNSPPGGDLFSRRMCHFGDSAFGLCGRRVGRSEEAVARSSRAARAGHERPRNSGPPGAKVRGLLLHSQLRGRALTQPRQLLPWLRPKRSDLACPCSGPHNRPDSRRGPARVAGEPGGAGTGSCARGPAGSRRAPRPGARLLGPGSPPAAERSWLGLRRPGGHAALSVVLDWAFCIPLYVPYVLTGRWPFSRGLCKLWLVVDYLLCTSSVFNIVLISYDRFLSVTRAVSYRAQQGDTRRAVQKMVMVWVLAFLLYGPAILSWEYLSGGSSIPEGHCYAEFFYNWYFLITASTLEFFTPFLSVTFFNLSIYLNIQRRTRVRLDGARDPEPPPEAQPSPPPAAPGCWGCRQKGRGEAVPLHRYGVGVGEAAPGAEAGEAALAGGSGGGAAASPTSSSGSSSRGTERPRSLKRGSKPSASSASLEKRMKMASQSITQRFRLSRDKKVAKSLAVIVSIFGLCWAPYTLLMIIRAACHGHCVPEYWYETSFWLLWANSAVNPVLYPLCHYSFRRAFTKLLCPQKLKIQPHSSLEHCWKKTKKKTRP
ncbi:histamine H3 receptor [Panthera uncia]|uniref:histamine H3 receptor n=1 Tax=Panthera uncia TaxID=29064 RepID=UPI0020FF9CA1|nr:histamine H3 receptor [Panthera uncia]